MSVSWRWRVGGSRHSSDDASSLEPHLLRHRPMRSRGVSSSPCRALATGANWHHAASVVSKFVVLLSSSSGSACLLGVNVVSIVDRRLHRKIKGMSMSSNKYIYSRRTSIARRKPVRCRYCD